MSHHALAWAMKQRLKPGAKLVLLVLADASNHEGASWLAVTTLSQRTCLGIRQVRKWLDYLSDLELISRESRTGQRGRQTTNVVTLNMAVSAPLIPQRQPRSTCSQPVDNFPRGVNCSAPPPTDTGVNCSAPLDPIYPNDQGVNRNSGPVENTYAERPSRVADYPSGSKYDPQWRPGKMNREIGRDALANWKTRRGKGNADR